MYRPTPLSTATLLIPNLISRLFLRRAFLPIAFALACFPLPPTTRAVSPPPDGGYPHGNTAEGDSALFDLTTGNNNTAIGNGALFSDTTGDDNTAIGVSALISNTTGRDNTATGAFALNSNTTGGDNTATGHQALLVNTTGAANTASGSLSLHANTTGNDNTASGFNALLNNMTGSNNNAFGSHALSSNTSGPFNNAFGNGALASNTTGDRNTAMGEGAMIASTTGSQNTAVGVSALRNNTTGFGNVAIGQDACNLNQGANSNTGVGWSALLNNTASTNTAVGYAALANNTTGHDNMAEGFEALANNTTGSSNIALGSKAGINLTTGSNNIEIGAPGVAAEANTIRIGKSGTQKKTFVAGIRGVTVASGVGVIVGTTGQLGTVLSSARFKDEIKPMDKASEAILNLKPVTFRYKEELDPDKIPQFGLIAEEVAKLNPDLVVRDENGEIYTVRYEAVNAMLLNEFLKEHRRVQEQQAIIAEMKSTIAKQDAINAQHQKEIEALTASFKKQAAQIQKVSEQLEVSKSSPRLVAYNR